MKIITREEAGAWCRKHGLGLTDQGLPAIRGLPDATDFAIPTDAGQGTALAREQIRSLAIDCSCLVWLDDWSVWPSGQWQHLFDRIRLSYGCDDTLIKRPAHLIDKTDIDAAVSIGVYAILMLWNCYVITDKGAWLFYSHDECGRIKR